MKIFLNEEKEMQHVLTELSEKYPQLLFPTEAGMSETQEYKDAVCYGKFCDRKPPYSMCEKDRLYYTETPVGTAEILLLYNRADFEKCACALTNRCEPKTIPPQVGAFMISGLLNWEKAHEFLKKIAGERELSNESIASLLKLAGSAVYDRLILLSSGRYSGVEAERFGLSDEEWIEKSVTIRMYHELTHFICRRIAPKNIDILRDEIFADFIGLTAAFGCYDIDKANAFLGINNRVISKDGRINYYFKDKDPNTMFDEIEGWMNLLSTKTLQPEKSIIDFISETFKDILQI